MEDLLDDQIILAKKKIQFKTLVNRPQRDIGK
jgi:hypothetical protein